MSSAKTTAILVDGAFYRRRAFTLFGDKAPKDRAEELVTYCRRHLTWDKNEQRDLYRIFYYDCPPSQKSVYHPLTQVAVDLSKTDLFNWTNDFFTELRCKRKVALRMGELLESAAGYTLKADKLRKLCRGDISVKDLTEKDFTLDIQQKGVDMRIGLDIASMAHKRLVNQIILIAGDSDFVPAAKHARREGIDIILDPMWNTIKPSLYEHIDGLHSCVGKPPKNLDDSLCTWPKAPIKI